MQYSGVSALESRPERMCVSVQSASCRNLKCQSHFLYLKYQIVRAEQKIISPMAKM